MDPIKPDYDGPCICNVVPALLDRRIHDWFPPGVDGASSVLFFLLDGLGWSALQQYRDELPVLSSLEATSINSVAPSSTASALTSVVTGLPPSQHGLVGYRMRVGPEILNVLGWFLPGKGDPPEPQQVQPTPAFGGREVKVVTRSEFLKTGFTQASMRGAKQIGWRVTSALVEHCRRMVQSGDPFIYAYYDGVDLVAHQFGLRTEFYVNELRAADRLVGDLLDVIPKDSVLVVLSDHGQVHLERKNWLPLDPCDRFTAMYGGDGRFRYLYAKPRAETDLLKAAREVVNQTGWVFSREEIVDGGWMGPRPEPWIADRIPEVVLAAREPVAYIDPTNPLEVNLRSGHGSLTADEIMVPLLVGTGRGS
jgi:hypothetical protein